MEMELGLGEVAEPGFGVDGFEGFRAGHLDSLVRPARTARVRADGREQEGA